MHDAAAGDGSRTEGPHLASSERHRSILLIVIFLPVIGALLAWLNRDWPTWARVIATLWSILIVMAAVGFASDVFGPREQNPVPHSAPAWTVNPATSF
jgi:NADH:ubiquinone oxidoreductase subunit 4 (subunit M)